MSRIIYKFILITILGSILQMANANLIEGKDYTVLNEEIPQLNPNKIEVLEFFGYFCSHCRVLESILFKESSNFQNDTYLRNIHVVWGDNLINLARILVAVNKSGTVRTATPEIFKAIFDDKIDLTDPKEFTKWAKNQKNWNSNALIKAFNSSDSLNGALRMKGITERYKVNSTPSIIVGGKYKLIFSMFSNHEEEVASYKKGMQTLNLLINKVRKERKLADSKKTYFIKSKSIELIKNIK